MYIRYDNRTIKEQTQYRDLSLPVELVVGCILLMEMLWSVVVSIAEELPANGDFAVAVRIAGTLLRHGQTALGLPFEVLQRNTLLLPPEQK